MRDDTTFGAHLRANFWLYVLSTVMVLAGVAAGVIGTAIDFDVWTSTATTPLAEINYGGGSIIFGVCTLTFAACASRLWRDHRVIFGFSALLVLLGFSVVSMVGIVGSGTKERLVPYTEGQAELLAKQEAIRQTNALQKSYVDKQLAYLQERGRQAKGPQSKQAAYTSASETFGALEVKPEPVLAARKDPIAEAINSLHPEWSIESIILVTSVAWGIALKLAEMLLIGFGVAMWPKAPLPRKEEAVPTADNLSEVQDVRPSAEIIRPEQFTKTSQPKAEDKEEAAVEALATDLFGDVQEHMTDVAAIEQFWGTQTRPAPVARIAAKAMYTAYCGWAASKSLRPASAQMFGRVASRLGMERDKTNPSQWAYVGRALIDVDDGAVILAA